MYQNINSIISIVALTIIGLLIIRELLNVRQTRLARRMGTIILIAVAPLVIAFVVLIVVRILQGVAPLVNIN